MRLTGKTGPWAVGVLAADDRAPGEVLPANDPNARKRAVFGIARVSRDILDQSTIGVLYTDREFAGAFNRVGGVDFSLKLGGNWRGKGQAVVSSTRETDGSYSAGPAYALGLTRAGRKFNFDSTYTDYSPGFVTHTGFANRVDLRSTNTRASYYWRPEGKVLISWGPTLSTFSLWDHRGVHLDTLVFPGIRFDLRRNTFFNVHPWATDHVYLRQADYAALPRVTPYPQPFWGAEGGSQYFKQVSLNFFFVSGGGVNYNPLPGRAPAIGHEDTGNVTLGLSPNNHLRIDNTYLLEHLRERDTRLTAVTSNVLRTKWNWQFTPALSARFILQYNAVLANSAISSLPRTKSVNADFLITYLVHPGTAVYVGYNSNLSNLDPRLLAGPSGLRTTRNDFINDARGFFAKVSYLWRF